MKLSKTPITLIFPQFTWSDYTNPSKSVLEDIAESLKIAPKVVLNCLDPDYLPHISFYGDVQFILLRLLEPKVKYSADTVQELTTKVALFISDKQIISIHRLDLVEIEHIQSKLKSFSESDVTRHHVVTYFFDEVSLGFNMPITELEHNLENFEEQIFKGSKSKSVLTDGYFIKRKASAFKKVSKFSLEILNKLIQKGECPLNKIQEVRDRFERNLFYADDMFENVQSLLNLHIAIASQKTNEASFKTNEIVRVLTVLTIFFSPLNFLTGIYGMNFEYMPFLKHESGFFIAIGLMTLVFGGLLVYVLRKGWLAPPPKN